MAKFLFFLLFALSAFVLLRGLRRREGVFEFPALFSGAFLFSIIPQLINHVFQPGRLPQRVYDEHGVEYALVMCILCLLCGLAGYGRPVRRLPQWMFKVPALDVRQLFIAGVVLGAIGLYGSIRLDALAGGFAARYTGGGHYGLEWRGLPVAFSYLAAALPLGYLLCLNSALMRGSFIKWAVTGTLLIYPALNVLFLGRRTMVFQLALYVGMAIWFRKRWAPLRWMTLVGLAAGALVIILAPAYRTTASSTGDVRAAIEGVDVEEGVARYAEGTRGEGMDNLVIGIPATLNSGAYSYGSALWNSLVGYLIPGQFVGYGLKENLMFQRGGDPDWFFNFAGVDVQYGSFTTGPYSAFGEFGFFGALLYFIIGRFCRFLWMAASSPGAYTLQVLCPVATMFVGLSVVDSIPSSLARSTYVCLLLFAAIYIARFCARRAGPVAVPFRSRAGKPGSALGHVGAGRDLL